MEHREYKSINKSVRKKDSMQLLLGKPVYTDDLVNNHPLVVKILRSPHPNAIVEEINTAIAKKVPGVVDIYTWRMCRIRGLRMQDRPIQRHHRMTD